MNVLHTAFCVHVRSVQAAFGKSAKTVEIPYVFSTGAIEGEATVSGRGNGFSDSFKNSGKQAKPAFSRARKFPLDIPCAVEVLRGWSLSMGIC